MDYNTEREMLEWAAKAGCIPLLDWRENWSDYGGAAWRTQARELWNPLTDDGDALRLAVTCGIDVRLFGLFPYDGKRHISTLVDRLGRGFNEFPGDGDQYAAARRAIVRAAAEIGKGIEQVVRGDLPEDNYYKTQAEAQYQSENHCKE